MKKKKKKMILQTDLQNNNQYRTHREIKNHLNSGGKLIDVVNHYISQIKKKQDLNAVLELYEAEILQKTEEIQTKIDNNTAGKLAGMVIGLKDNICYENHKSSASSKILDGFISPYNATVVQRLLDEDALIIARLNCDEFAMGASNENSAYGPVKNALDPSKVPGGSSGGSAVAVQANMCTLALGSDTGGSIRQPASFTGTFGIKPTYGSVSRWGLIAYASSFDQIGPIANSVEDLELVYNIISGKDNKDATCILDSDNHLINESSNNIAVLKDCLNDTGLDPEIRTALETTIAHLKKEGYKINYVDFPYLNHMVPSYYVLTTAEASSNLARFSGLLFGKRSQDANDLESTFIKSRTEGFGTEVKRRIMSGTFVLSSDYFDSYYTKAQKIRRIIQDKTNEILQKNDFILLPTTPTTAFNLGDKTLDPIAMYLADIYTVQAPLAGLPAVSLPLNVHSNGMPFGTQIIGQKFGEKQLFQFSEKLSQIFKKNES